ncbi:MAG: DUF561 domain-containing protein, partial [Cyanobacteria bacterium J06627_15]
MMLPTLQAALDQGRALKIISGLNNFRIDNVMAVARAAQLGGATFLDMAADAGLVRAVRQQVDLPICVSAV